MADNNFSQLEAKAGKKAALKLRQTLRKTIQHGFETTKGNSALLKSTVTSKSVAGELQRLVIKMPRYGFMHHFGYDGVKSNGVKLRLLGNKGFLSDAMHANKTLEDLATEITIIRGDQVTANINF